MAKLKNYKYTGNIGFKVIIKAQGKKIAQEKADKMKWDEILNGKIYTDDFVITEIK